MEPDGLLDPREQDRLDLILSAARNLHYWNFAVAGSAVLGALQGGDSVKVPLLDVSLSTGKAGVALYFLSILLTVANDRLFQEAYRWIRLDPRRPRFPWHALGSGPVSFARVSIWIYLPVVITASAAALSLGPQPLSSGLLLPGLLLAGSSRVFGHYWPLIRERRDHRGGPATFSMWLLYIYRLLRIFLLPLAFAAFVLAALPDLRAAMLHVIKWLAALLITAWALRLVGAFFYKAIDRAGVRFGFPATNEHD